MSFILDALRKSEHERQKQAGPTLAESAVAPAKTRTNAWATAAVALLVVNLAAIGVLLLVRSRDVPDASPVAAPAPPATAQPDAATGEAMAVPAAPAAQASVTRLAPAATAAQAAPPPALERVAPRPPPAARNRLEDEVSSGAALDPEAALHAAAPPPGPPAVTPARRGSVVYESLPGTAPVASGTAGSFTASAALPTADDLAASGGLPELRLELHVYSNRREERFVFVNGRRYREGDTTQEGAAVEEITRDGVVMNLRGSRFLLARD